MLNLKLFRRASLLVALGALTAAPARAQAPATTWAWALHVRCSFDINPATIQQVATDAAGNAYIAGVASTTVHAPVTIQIGSTSLPCASTGPIEKWVFVAKISPTGSVDWARASGQGAATVSGLTVDAAGNVYIQGRFQGRTSFGTYYATAPGHNGHTYDPDNYLAKLDAQGQWQWARVLGNSPTAVGGGMTTMGALTADPVGHLTVTANGPNATFGTVVLTAAPAPRSGFIAQYDAAGQPRWANTAVGSTTITALKADAAGDLYVAGTYSGSAHFGSTTLVPLGGTDAFVAKVNGPNGQWMWATALGGAGNDEAVALAKAGGQLAVVANITGATNIGTAGAGGEAATALLDAGTGQILSGTATGSAGATVGRAVALSPDGYTLTGFSASGAAAYQGQALPYRGGTDSYLGASAGPGGSPAAWALAIGGSGDEIITAVSAPTAGTALVAGSFTSTSLTLGGTTLTNPSGTDAFLARLGTPLGARDEETVAAFGLTPNPASTTARLTLPQAPAAPLTAQLVDAVGRVVRSQTVRARETLLDLYGLPAGLYVVRCGAATRRLVLQ